MQMSFIELKSIESAFVLLLLLLLMIMIMTSVSKEEKNRNRLDTYDLEINIYITIIGYVIEEMKEEKLRR